MKKKSESYRTEGIFFSETCLLESYTARIINSGAFFFPHDRHHARHSFIYPTIHRPRVSYLFSTFQTKPFFPFFRLTMRVYCCRSLILFFMLREKNWFPCHRKTYIKLEFQYHESRNRLSENHSAILFF